MCLVRPCVTLAWVNQGGKSINIAQEIANVLEVDVVNLFIEDVEDGKLCITK